MFVYISRRLLKSLVVAIQQDNFLSNLFNEVEDEILEDLELDLLPRFNVFMERKYGAAINLEEALGTHRKKFTQFLETEKCFHLGCLDAVKKFKELPTREIARKIALDFLRPRDGEVDLSVIQYENANGGTPEFKDLRNSFNDIEKSTV